MVQVKHIRARNVLGIEDVELSPGKVTVIEGGNAQGKTSVVEALKAAIGGGYDASLVRDGADHAEVVLVLDDETEITKRIRRTGGGDTKVRHPDFGNVSAPQTFLAGITNAISFNPVMFLVAKDRARALLEAIPMQLPREELAAAVAGTFFKSVDQVLTPGRHALDAIETVRKQLFDERTGVNRTAKDKRRTAEGLRDSLPAEVLSGTVLENHLADARGAHQDAETELTRALGSIDAETERGIAQAVGLLQEGLDRSQKATEGEVIELREQITALQEKVAVVLRRHDENRVAFKSATAEAERRIRAHAQTKKDDLLVQRRPQVNDLAAAATRLEEQLRAADRNENTRRILERAEVDATASELEAGGLTEALERLDGLRDRLMAEIPIEGVTIRDGEVLVDGHPFHRVNRARQVRVAVQLATLRAGKLPLVCVDEMECLDAETFEAFVQELEKSKLQAIVTRVTAGPLKIRTNAVPVVGAEA